MDSVGESTLCENQEISEVEHQGEQAICVRFKQDISEDEPRGENAFYARIQKKSEDETRNGCSSSTSSFSKLSSILNLWDGSITAILKRTQHTCLLASIQPRTSSLKFAKS